MRKLCVCVLLLSLPLTVMASGNKYKKYKSKKHKVTKQSGSQGSSSNQTSNDQGSSNDQTLNNQGSSNGQMTNNQGSSDDQTTNNNTDGFDDRGSGQGGNQGTNADTGSFGNASTNNTNVNEQPPEPDGYETESNPGGVDDADNQDNDDEQLPHGDNEAANGVYNRFHQYFTDHPRILPVIMGTVATTSAAYLAYKVYRYVEQVDRNLTRKEKIRIACAAFGLAGSGSYLIYKGVAA